jgi:hypothetical protein
MKMMKKVNIVIVFCFGVNVALVMKLERDKNKLTESK